MNPSHARPALHDPAAGAGMPTPVKGTWIRHEPQGLVLGASGRSPMAFFYLIFLVVWVPIMTRIAFAGSGGSITHPRSLFQLVILLASASILYSFLFSVWGRVELVIGRESSVFVGVGPLGLRRGFDWEAVTGVTQGLTRLYYNRSRRPLIQLEGSRKLRFGALLGEARLMFLLDCLQRLKAARGRY